MHVVFVRILVPKPLKHRGGGGSNDILFLSHSWFLRTPFVTSAESSPLCSAWIPCKAIICKEKCQCVSQSLKDRCVILENRVGIERLKVD